MQTKCLFSLSFMPRALQSCNFLDIVESSNFRGNPATILTLTIDVIQSHPDDESDVGLYTSAKCLYIPTATLQV